MVNANEGLVDRRARPDEQERLRRWLPNLPRLELNPREKSDLDLIGIGAFTPLEGFMGKADYDSVVARMRLASDAPWSLPITLSASAAEARGLAPGVPLVLCYRGAPAGVLHLEETFPYDKEHEAKKVFGTTSLEHPGVKALFQQGEFLLGGKITLLEEPSWSQFAPYDRGPAATRRLFAEKGWRQVAGFQTRNPIHRAHEYIQKCALEVMDGLLVHPLVGETKEDDIPADVRMKCYEVLLDRYYPKDRVVLNILPAAMRYAGPREAIFHALVRKNYGCTHFIVGRDHAGVGNFYGPYDAQRIFDQFVSCELGIEPLFFENAFYCRECGGMASTKSCPHSEGDRVVFSGTQVRRMLREGKLPPPEFTRPEVARILLESLSGSQ